MWPAIIAGVGALASTALGVREAGKARKWQEKMSNTAHQREALDMEKAGINPIMSSRGAGASTPQGAQADFSEIGRAAGTALAVQSQRAQLELIKAQTEATSAQAAKTKVEALDIQATSMGRAREINSRADIAQLDYRQRTDLFDTVISQARAQLDLTTHSARGAKARAVLDELDQARGYNAESLEKWLTGGTPGVRLFMEILRNLPGAPSKRR